MLDILFRGLKTSPVACANVRPLWRPKDKKIAIFDPKNLKKFYSCKFFQFLAITLDPELDPDPDPQLGKMLDPDPH